MGLKLPDELRLMGLPFMLCLSIGLPLPMGLGVLWPSGLPFLSLN